MGNGGGKRVEEEGGGLPMRIEVRGCYSGTAVGWNVGWELLCKKFFQKRGGHRG